MGCCTLLNSFRNLFKIFEQECVHSDFLNAPHILLIIQGTSPLLLIPGGIYPGGSCPGLAEQGDFIKGKLSWGQMSRGQLRWGDFIGVIVQEELFRGNSPGGKTLLP